MERIKIALAANEPYFCGMLVTACSIAKYADENCHLRFYILDGGISSTSIELLKKKVTERHQATSFTLIKVDETDFADCPSWNGSRLIYARLMLPKWLPDVDWVIYCDVDLLWMRDVSELWHERDDAYAYIGVLDPSSSTRESDEEWSRTHGLICPADEYCCAGLSFMNLKMFREEGLFDRVMELNRLHPPYNDQTLFNIVTHGRKKIVGEEWQSFSRLMTKGKLDDGVVIHYAGQIPWKPLTRLIHPFTDAMMLWHRLHADILGISVWRALRMCFSVGGILWHRGFFWLMQFPGMKQSVKVLCNIIGHRGVWVCLEPNVRRLG